MVSVYTRLHIDLMLCGSKYGVTLGRENLDFLVKAIYLSSPLSN